MICPQCQSSALRVIDSRDVETEPAVRRRRECESCSFRFTTYERVEARQLSVLKKDGTREEFDRDKLARGIWRACEKRPVSEAGIEKVVSGVHHDITQGGETDIPAERIGEVVMNHLKNFDQIAYIRFASVYREFADLGELQKEVARTLRYTRSKKVVT